jgi:hypothetical protein
VNVLRTRPLDRGNAVAVEAELQHVRGLFRPRELRIERLVAPRSELRIAFHLEQEIGAPAPGAVGERRLENDVRALAHRFDRPRGSGVEIPVLHRDLDDLPALRVHAHQHVGLVLHALVRQKLRAFVECVRFRPLAERHLPRERGAMLALDVVVQIRRREEEMAVAAQHAAV